MRDEKKMEEKGPRETEMKGWKERRGRHHQRENESSTKNLRAGSFLEAGEMIAIATRLGPHPPAFHIALACSNNTQRAQTDDRRRDSVEKCKTGEVAEDLRKV